MDYDTVNYAIRSVLNCKLAYCKFLSANDTGLTGGHQSGIYVSKPAVPILFDEPGIKGSNKDRWANILWMDGAITEVRFIYYGGGTRNEYRITNFGRGFIYLRPEYTGALFVLCKKSDCDYEGFVMNTDDEIEQFLDAFGIGPSETNNLINTASIPSETLEKSEIERVISDLNVDFPSSEWMSDTARQIQDQIYNHNEMIVENPDRKLLDWTDMEYRLFRAIEYSRYEEAIKRGFSSVDEFVTTANQVLNRRKSRAGKSLEHHLSAIFTGNNLLFEEQAITEGNKKPDFIFPSGEKYHSADYSVDKIVSLAAKTTCKDRWRQILNEANRLRDKPKYLFTLQQGVSAAQMDEMAEENVILVVPMDYHICYPTDKRERLWTLARFVSYVKMMESV